MDFIRVLGFLIMPLGILGISLWVYLKRNPQIESFQDLIAMLTGLSERPAKAILENDILPTDRGEMFDAPTGERLDVVEPNQVIDLVDKNPHRVQARAVLTEMWQQVEGSSPWIPKPRSKEFTIIFLTNGQILARIRSVEGGPSIWLQSVSYEYAKLMRFFIGTDSVPGPARRFRNNGQGNPIAFNFPGSIRKANGRYLITDIGRYRVTKMSGQSEIFEERDFFPFILARKALNNSSDYEFGENWTLYLDQRTKLAAGTGGLFVLQEFEPDFDVEMLL